MIGITATKNEAYERYTCGRTIAALATEVFCLKNYLKERVHNTSPFDNLVCIQQNHLCHSWSGVMKIFLRQKESDAVFLSDTLTEVAFVNFGTRQIVHFPSTK